jgi:hypothetical protein
MLIPAPANAPTAIDACGSAMFSPFYYVKMFDALDYCKDDENFRVKKDANATV